MWTHKVGAVFRKKGQTEVEVAFMNDTDPTINFSIMYSISSMDQLKQLIQNQLEAANLGDDLYGSLVPGESVDLSANRTDTAREIYFDLLNKWNRTQEDIKNGLLKADDPLVVQLATDLKAAYKPEYSGL